jgi:hypothetical protein
MTEKSEALRLADELDKWCKPGRWTKPRYAAAELRRLHALNGELLEALDAILNGHGDPDIPEAALAKVRATIARAEGKV